MPKYLAPALIALLASAPAVVHAQALDPAAAQIEAFDNGVLNIMKQAKGLGIQGRFHQFEPLLERTFDIPLMTAYAVGPTWSSIPPAEQAGLIRAFGRMTAATYAHNFDAYGGERFVLDPHVQTRGPDKLVRTQLVGSTTHTLAYRMRQAGGVWKVIDVYYNGAISSLAGQRSEFASTLRSGGAPALIRKLNDRAAELLK